MNKKKIALLAMSLCMIAILAVGGSLAFLTDFDHQINVFTAGHVDIKLDEAIVKNDPETDNLVALKPEDVEEGEPLRTPLEMTEQKYKLHPNMKVTKDPTITVHTESERCYVGARVTVKSTGDLHELYGVEGYRNLDIHGLVSGGLVSQPVVEQHSNWNNIGMAFETADCVIYQAPVQGENAWDFYIFMLDAMEPGEAVTLFNTMTIDPKFDNKEMAILNNMSIEVQAFAVQADGFEIAVGGNRDEACFNAMTEAFRDKFPFDNNYTTVTETAA